MVGKPTKMQAVGTISILRRIRAEKDYDLHLFPLRRAYLFPNMHG
jgi:hypothetical protein